MRRASAVAVALGALFLASACKRTLDEEQCDKMVEHMLDLMAKAERDEARAEKIRAAVKADKRTVANVRESCVGKTSKAQLDCVMAASSFDEAAACDK